MPPIGNRPGSTYRVPRKIQRGHRARAKPQAPPRDLFPLVQAVRVAKAVANPPRRPKPKPNVPVGKAERIVRETRRDTIARPKPNVPRGKSRQIVRATRATGQSEFNRQLKRILSGMSSPTKIAGSRTPAMPLGLKPLQRPRHGGGGLLATALGAGLNAIPGLQVLNQTPVGGAVRGLLTAEAHDPIGVPLKTTRGLVNSAVATPAALAQLAGQTIVPLVTGHPGRALQGVENVGSLLGTDLSRRYGPLLSGNDQAFSERIRKEGAAPELLDALSVLAPAGAVTGRALGVAARSGRLGRTLERVATEPRPPLRISGDLAKPQRLSRNLGTAALQRAEDSARARVLGARTKAAVKREARGEIAYEPMKPGRGEVRPISRRLEARAQRIDVSGVQSRRYLAQRRERQVEVTKGVEHDLRGLSRKEQRAVFHSVQGLLPDGGSADAIRSTARRRAKQIVGEREGRVVERALRKEGRSAGDAHRARQIVREARLKGSAPATADGLVRDLEAVNAPAKVVAAARGSRTALKAALDEPKVIRHHSELAALRFIDKHAEELASSRRLGEFRARTLETSKRTEAGDPAFTGEEALARRYEPQAEFLGMPNPVREAEDRIARQLEDGRISPKRADELTAQLEKRAPDMTREWVGKVQRAAEKEGLPEPAYVLHQPGLQFRLSDMSFGNIASAMRGVRQSRQELFKAGRAVAHPRVVLHGIATNIKRKHQWAAVADVRDRHSLPWSRGRTGSGQSIAKLQQGLRRRGLDPEEWVAMDTRRFREIESGLGVEGESFGQNPALHHALQATMVPLGRKGLKGEDAVPTLEQRLEQTDPQAAAKYKNTSGFVLVPKEVARELLAGTRPPGGATRVFGKLQGLQSKAILGYSPSWLGMQVAANTLATVFGTRGMIGDLAKAHSLYKQLTPAERELLDGMGGVGVLEGHARTPQLGSAVESPVVEAARRIGDTKIARTLKGVDPARLLFAADDKQNLAFRRAVVTNDLKRRAFRKIRQDAGVMAEAQARLEQVLRLKPTDTVMQQVSRILQHPHEVEELGRHVNAVLGDYVRYTAKERRALKPYVLFYGFLRYALRTAFYTMPVHHPVMSSIALKLGQLHTEEVKDLLGGDQAPWAYSRIFFDKNGKLQSIDLARINPVTSPLTEVATENSPSALAGLVSPVVQAAADQIYGGVVYEGGRGFHVNGKAPENRFPGLSERARIVLNDVLGSAFPYRMASQITQKGRQGDDTLLFDARPIKYQTIDAQARNLQQIKQAGDWRQRLLQQVFPLFVPKPDERTRDYVRKRAGLSTGAPTRAPSPAQREILEIQRRLAGQQRQAPQVSQEILDIQRRLAAQR